jgi:hypothetical protein
MNNTTPRRRSKSRLWFKSSRKPVRPHYTHYTMPIRRPGGQGAFCIRGPLGVEVRNRDELPHPYIPTKSDRDYLRNAVHYNKRLPIKPDRQGNVDLDALEDDKLALLAIGDADLKFYGQFGLGREDVNVAIKLIDKLIEWRDRTGVFVPARDQLELPLRENVDTIGAAPPDNRTAEQREKDQVIDDELDELYASASQSDAVPFDRLALAVGFYYGGKDKRLIVNIANAVNYYVGVTGVLGAAAASNISADRTTREINFEDTNEVLDKFFEWAKKEERDYQKAANKVGIDQATNDYLRKQNTRVKNLLRKSAQPLRVPPLR